MKMPISEIADRYSIAILKKERKLGSSLGQNMQISFGN